MEIVLERKIKQGVTIIEGFPGIGLVGTIATEFLIEHLKAKPIGMIKGSEIPPMVAVHQGKLVRPLGLFYAEKENILILHVISGIPGSEWEIAEILKEQAKKLKAAEIVSLESVTVPTVGAFSAQPQGFYFTNNEDSAKLMRKIGLDSLKEGIVVGVTGALMLSSDTPLTCIFAETHSKLPDSKAAAKIIEILNKYLGLKIDTAPLIRSAEQFEEKIKTILEKSKQAQELQEKKGLGYMG